MGGGAEDNRGKSRQLSYHCSMNGIAAAAAAAACAGTAGVVVDEVLKPIRCRGE